MRTPRDEMNLHSPPPTGPHPQARPCIRLLSRFVFCLALWAAVVLVSEAAARATEGLTVAAASSLQVALRDVDIAWRAQGAAPLTMVFSASGQLARQIENGAPYDVFAPADPVWLERLAQQGAIEPGSITIYAQGSLALAVGAEATLLHAPEVLDAQALGILRRADFRVIGVANPSFAPYGAAAQAALRAAGLWELLAPRLVYGDNVRQVLTYVQTGNAEAGLVAASLLPRSRRNWRPIRPDLYPPLYQAVGVVAATRHPEAARAFAAFLSGPLAQPLLERYGFRPPQEDTGTETPHGNVPGAGVSTGSPGTAATADAAADGRAAALATIPGAALATAPSAARKVAR